MMKSSLIWFMYLVLFLSSPQFSAGIFQIPPYTLQVKLGDDLLELLLFQNGSHNNLKEIDTFVEDHNLSSDNRVRLLEAALEFVSSNPKANMNTTMTPLRLQFFSELEAHATLTQIQNSLAT